MGADPQDCSGRSGEGIEGGVREKREAGACIALTPLRPRMKLPMHLAQILPVDVRVDLRRGNIGMPEKFLLVG